MTQADLEWAEKQGLSASANGSKPDSQSESLARLEIQVRGRHMRDITQYAVAALKSKNGDQPVLFSRGTSLVRLQTGDSGTVAEALGQASLRGVLDRAANFVKFTEKGDTPARPPGDVVADILTLPNPGFPWLQGFSEAPVFLPSGNLLSKSGYDAESGLYVTLNGLDGIRSDMAIQDAVSLLQDELLRDFPFADIGSKAHALALLVQPYVRYLIDGVTPLILIDAPARGTGKGLLVDVVSGISLGRPAQVMALPRDEDELEKRITATWIQGFPMILLDNVVALKSASLSAVLTTTSWRGRRLGRSEMVVVPNTATWIATGNNVAFSDEMVRRTVHIRLDAGVERPEERTGFHHPDLMAWVRLNRTRLVSACLSLVQAWIDAGMPKGKGTLGRFERWVEVMGGILDVADVKGFLSNRESLYANADADSYEWSALGRAWWTQYGDRIITAKDLLGIAKDKNLLLDLWGGRSGLSGQQRMGHALGAHRDRVFRKYRIKRAGADSRTNSAAYRLEEVATKTTETTEITPGRLETGVEMRVGFEMETTETPQANGQNPPGDSGTKTVVSVVSGVLSGRQVNNQVEL